MKSYILAAAAVALGAGCVTEAERSQRTLPDLVAARSVDDLARANEARRLTKQLLRRAEHKAQSAGPGARARRSTCWSSRAAATGAPSAPACSRAGDASRARWRGRSSTPSPASAPAR